MGLAEGRQAPLAENETPFLLIAASVFAHVSAAAIALLILAALSPPAHGQAVCDRREKIAARLESRYQEFQQAWGMSNTGQLVELWATEDGGTWTLVLSHANGISCLIGAGVNWQDARGRPPL